MFVRLAQGFTGVYTLTAHLEAFTDWYALYTAGASGPGTGPQHYAVRALVCVLTPNVVLDIRAGGGLTKAADHFFAGAGLALRYEMPLTFPGVCDPRWEMGDRRWKMGWVSPNSQRLCPPARLPVCALRALVVAGNLCAPFLGPCGIELLKKSQPGYLENNSRGSGRHRPEVHPISQVLQP
jgi:hypothetical protein